QEALVGANLTGNLVDLLDEFFDFIYIFPSHVLANLGYQTQHENVGKIFVSTTSKFVGHLYCLFLRENIGVSHFLTRTLRQEVLNMYISIHHPSSLYFIMHTHKKET
ncbi:hypothetical protein ACJX0J_019197, partial [Zea mays]